MQRAWVILENAQVSIELPAQDAEILPGVLWGRVEAFPTPAYWAYQVIARRIASQTVRYKLGATLREEVGACLLGGHGIPASIGLAAFEHLKQKGAFAIAPPDEQSLRQWLSEPITSGDRQVRYRFASQKAKYLAAALRKIANESAPSTGRALRDWIISVPGIGYKTASWIARNWLDADDVAILDIHILRAGVIAGFLNHELTVERHYLQLEAQFLELSRAMGAKPSELDAVIWLEMAHSRATVERILNELPEGNFKRRHASSRPSIDARKPHSHQLSLLR
ncbi:8-oxoguanine DNA glycosylase [Xanthomonas arboricola]|uniref:8-oxoguanine DNA glycosylase n=1 Tax=Xanthomonas arboricola TaxID=56448 RepID=UPI0020193F15|nr:8-oxoguanine DNA glycosylase [Xanthomonas arboricola]UQQ16508.1 8-oxoguanine DNA glycosylase [Xanthomonas arboricola pv. corylina]